MTKLAARLDVGLYEHKPYPHPSKHMVESTRSLRHVSEVVLTNAASGVSLTDFTLSPVVAKRLCVSPSLYVRAHCRGWWVLYQAQ